MIQNFLIDDLKLKWNRIQQSMQQSGADGCLLSIDVNLFYVTGRIFSGYFYLPAEGEPCFFVKRPNNLSGERLEYIRKPEQMPELFAKYGLKMPRKLLLEADELSYSEYMRLQNVFAPEETANATALMRAQRMVKTPYEIEQFRKVAAEHSLVYTEVPECYKPGMTDIELQSEIERRMRLHGSIGLFRAFGANMDIFMGSLLAGENAEAPSPFDFALGGEGVSAAAPLGANGTLLKEGTAIMVDMAGNYTPYMTDMSRIFSVGKLTDQAYRAHQTSLEIQADIMANARPGVGCADLYQIAMKHVEKAGLQDNFMGTKQQAKFVGHGIGLQINELPVLTPRSREELSASMVFALEPKFVIPGVGAVGVENSFLVTDTGLEKLTLFTEDIIELH